MSSQVVRIESFGKGSLGNIGKEVERSKEDSLKNRNADIDKNLTPMNEFFKKTENGMYAEFKKVNKELNVTNADNIKKNMVAFEGMVITSDKAFFENMGYVPGKRPPRKVRDFFKKAYEFARKEIGFKGGDENILSAVVHYDETTPHLQLYYVPIVDSWKEKIYEKDENGKVKKNENGSPIQARDENGKIIYNIVKNGDERRINRSQFWQSKGGNTSYTQMQDRFFDQVSKSYGLDRGEKGSTREHTTKAQWELKKLAQQNGELAQNKIILEKEIKGGVYNKDGEVIVTPGLENKIFEMSKQKEQLQQETENLDLQLKNKKQEYDFYQGKISELSKKFLDERKEFNSLQNEQRIKTLTLEKDYDAAKKKYDVAPLKKEYETVKLLYGDPVELTLQAKQASKTLQGIQNEISKAMLSVVNLKNENSEIGQNIASQTMILNNLDRQIKEKESFLEQMEKILLAKISNILENFWHDVKDSIYFANKGDTDIAEYSLTTGQKKAHEDAADLPEEPKQILKQSIDQKVEEITETYIRPRKRGR